MSSFSIGMGGIYWVVVSEIFPTRVRGAAMSLSVVFLWGGNYLVSQFFPAMLAALHSRVFFVFALMCGLCLAFVWRFVPRREAGLWRRSSGSCSGHRQRGRHIRARGTCWRNLRVFSMMEVVAQNSILQPGPIRRTKLYELVTQKLEDMIRLGELKPGDKLPSERDIMAAFNIGRPAVREALLSLQSKGLIVTENGRRATVSKPSVDNVLTTLDSVVGVIIANAESSRICTTPGCFSRRRWRIRPGRSTTSCWRN